MSLLKQYIALFVILLLLAQCSKNQSEITGSSPSSTPLSLALPPSSPTEEEPATLRGEISGVPDGEVSLFIIPVPNATGTTLQTQITDGKFEFPEIIQEPSPAYISFADGTGDWIFLDSKQQRILGTKDSLGEAKIEGSDENQIYKDLRNQLSSAKTSHEIGSILVSSAVSHPNSSAVANTSVQLIQYLNLDQMKSILATFSYEVNDLSFMEIFRSRYKDLKELDQGKPAPDFTQDMPDGSSLTFSSLKGNPVLIHFWASWCPFCTKSLPQLKSIHAKFESKGLLVLGVSLDSKKTDWEKAIKGNKLDWLHVSELNAWDNSASNLYQVSSLPHFTLVNSEGIIVKNEIPLSGLEQTVNDFFNNN